MQRTCTTNGATCIGANIVTPALAMDTMLAKARAALPNQGSNQGAPPEGQVEGEGAVAAGEEQQDDGRREAHDDQARHSGVYQQRQQAHHRQDHDHQPAPRQVPARGGAGFRVG